ncbi:MAG TPA: hypothetical protein VMW83_10140 [Spirochaetia bacterium]|nr:hypothetical protein [Spirochaetia bacterium]
MSWFDPIPTSRFMPQVVFRDILGSQEHLVISDDYFRVGVRVI